MFLWKVQQDCRPQIQRRKCDLGGDPDGAGLGLGAKKDGCRVGQHNGKASAAFHGVTFLNIET